jgi:SHAQKYF class myb-like DNA-binding protein
MRDNIESSMIQAVAAESESRDDDNPNPSRKRKAVSQLSSSATQLWENENDDDDIIQTAHKVAKVIDQGDTDGSISLSENEDPEDDDDDEAQEEVWPLSLHRSLVEAIYEVGLKHASPAVLMEQMQFLTESVTSERVKSHLQKYRNNKEKNKEEFMKQYDNGLLSAQTETAIVPGPLDRYHGGERAAYLTYLVLQEERRKAAPDFAQSDPLTASTTTTTTGITPHNDQILSFPTLTEEEQKTPLGGAIRQVVGLFHPLAQYVWSERIKKTTASATPSPTSSDAAQLSQPQFSSSLSCQESSECNPALHTADVWSYV